MPAYLFGQQVLVNMDLVLVILTQGVFMYMLLPSAFNNSLLIQWGNTGNGSGHPFTLPLAYTSWYRCVTSYPNTDSQNTARWVNLQIVTTSLTSVTSGYEGVPEDFITIGI